MKQNSKTKAALTIVLGIFIVAVAVCVTIYYLQDLEPTTSQNEGTKLAAYDNSQYSYKFQYDPKQYNASESKSRGGATGAESDLVTLSAKKNGSACPEATTVFISTATLAEELKDLDFRIEGENNEVTISGVKATQRVGTLTENQPTCGNEVTEVVFSHKDKTFVVRADKDSRGLLNEVLATFELY
ncbi:hypothetical protein KJ903_01065 [Patescibacteria group bacterium]|nr:hypothetical protein [Patescibacteria group bacterium]